MLKEKSLLAKIEEVKFLEKVENPKNSIIIMQKIILKDVYIP